MVRTGQAGVRNGRAAATVSATANTFADWNRLQPRRLLILTLVFKAWDQTPEGIQTDGCLILSYVVSKDLHASTEGSVPPRSKPLLLPAHTNPNWTGPQRFASNATPRVRGVRTNDTQLPRFPK